jgi:MFS family permease
MRKWTASAALERKNALFFVVLLGCVSLFSDMTYEGARSVTGPYLKILGASATVVGIVAGLGELIGYAFRLLSGMIADRTRRYWTLTLIGYAVNLFAVPMLAFTGNVAAASSLLVLERFGKAIRKPSSDAMLSFARDKVGSGWTYGLHEAMDQIGAVAGPLIISAILYSRADDYRRAFAILAIPAAIAIAILVSARFLFPDPTNLEVNRLRVESRGFGRHYWIYIIASGFVGLGFADWALVAYHFEAKSIFPDAFIPVLYAVAMGTDALAALFFGRLYDRIGPSSIALAALLSATFAPLVFLGGRGAAILGAGLWGVGMGWQESIMRSLVADLTPKKRRASAFGLFHTSFGVFWFLGSTIIGLLYGISIFAVVAFSLATQLIAAGLFLSIARSHSK